MRGRVVVAVIATLTLGAEPAMAAFPGANGKIFFARDVGANNFDIFSMNADGSGATNLTRHPNPSSTHAVSADGQESSSPGSIDGGQDDIILMNADGTGAQNLTQTPRPSTSHGSRRTGRRSSTSATRTSGSSRSQAGSRPICTSTASPIHESAPEFSPDGATIVYSRTPGGPDDLWTIRPDGPAPAASPRPT